MTTRALVPDEALTVFGTCLRDYLRSTMPTDRVREIATQPEVVREWWVRLAEEIGVQGLLLAERDGGLDAGIGAAVVCCQELGGGLAPGPFIPTLAAAQALARHSYDDRLEPIRKGLAGGFLWAGVVEASESLAIEIANENAVVDGWIGTLPYGAHLDVVLIRAEVDGRAVLLTGSRDETWSHRGVETLDVTQAMGSIECARSSFLVTEEPDEASADIVTLLACAMQLGLMQRCLSEAVRYLSDRVAFGRRVASFQSVKHQLAELLCVYTQAEALISDATAATAEGAADAVLSTTAAWCYTGPKGVWVASECLRLLGGIGYTWEHDAHVYFRRARAIESFPGPLVRYRHRLAVLLGLGGGITSK